MDWKNNIIINREDIRALLEQTKRVAVLGIRSEKHSSKPAFYVPQYLADAGLDIIPIPVYELEVSHILGQQTYHKLSDVPSDIDLVDVFRRSEDIEAHVEDIVLKKPKAVWFQLGIRNDKAAETLAQAGIKVVQDRCLMVDYRNLIGSRRVGT
jgi:uncharacterized protein